MKDVFHTVPHFHFGIFFSTQLKKRFLRFWIFFAHFMIHKSPEKKIKNISFSVKVFISSCMYLRSIWKSLLHCWYSQFSLQTYLNIKVLVIVTQISKKAKELFKMLTINNLNINIYFKCSFIHLRDKYELSIDQLPVGLIAELVRALHRYRRGHGFDPRSSRNFFRFLLFNRLG